MNQEMGWLHCEIIIKKYMRTLICHHKQGARFKLQRFNFATLHWGVGARWAGWEIAFPDLVGTKIYKIA